MASRPLPPREHAGELAYDIAVGDMSQHDAAVVMAGLVSDHKRFVDRHRRSILKFERSIERHLADRSRVVSDRTMRRFLAFSQEQRSSSYGLTDFRPDSFQPEQLTSAKRLARETSEKMMARARVDTEALKQVDDKTIKRSILNPRELSKGGRRLAVTSVADAVQALHGSGDSFVKTAPFDATGNSYSAHKWGGQLDFRSNNEVLHNPLKYVTGKLGHDSDYRNKSASDFDGLFFNLQTRVGFWYTPPGPGMRQIWIKIRVRTSRADVWLEDEFGWSSSSQGFFSRFEISIDQFQGIQGATDDFTASVGGAPGEGTWTTKPLIVDNAEIWLPFAVDLPPSPVFLWIIANDQRQTILNDVSTDSRMRTQYEVQEVHFI